MPWMAPVLISPNVVFHTEGIMRYRRMWLLLAAVPLAFLAIGQDTAPDENPNQAPDLETVQADVVATGIPGAGAIAQIDTFHKGGPFHDNATFAASTQPGKVLDRTRLLVASTSNFGAPLARPTDAPGAVLSIDVSNGPVSVPPNFAAGDGQAIAVNGKVIMFAAQSPAFLNGLNNASAATSNLPSVGLPLGISINNGFGRVWFANAPGGSAGDGTITVIDPSGIPLAGAPSPVAGGVFAGSVTNRGPASTQGLTAGALATALAGKSPDQSVRAVFFAALADGSIAQVHVQKGVDALAPPGSFTPIPGVNTDAAESSDPGILTRVGIAFNWVPTRILYVTDPLANRILALDISDEGVAAQTLLTASNPRYLQSQWLDKPVDIAPAAVEVSARNFASNTTLGGGSDFYVLNRGNNTIVRMRQDGTVVAARKIDTGVPEFRVNGLAVSEDARTIWITATAPQRQGFVLRTATFGAGFSTNSMIESAVNAGANGAVAQGTDMFTRDLTPAEGLGPLFNGQTCDTCHNTAANAAFAGGMGVTQDTFVTRIGRLQKGQFQLLPGRAPIARQHSVAELGVPCGLPTGIPPEANATSLRSAPTLRGTSLLDNIRIGDIDRVRAAEPDAVRGRFNTLADGRRGRFGWKAQTATLVEFMGEAFRDENGLSSPLAPYDYVSGCGQGRHTEADAAPLTSVVAFLNTIDPPAPAPACINSPGKAVFSAIGCAQCHTPSLPGPGSAAPVFAFSDLLLHDMGPGLADGFVQGSATGSEFRTAPLWRAADRSHFLHDGRATTITNAILAHGGQAAAAKAAFSALSASDLQALLDFLNCI